MHDSAPPESGAQPASTPPSTQSSVAPAPTTLSAKLSKVIHKGLFSSPARFVGGYEDDTILITHAWPSLSDPTAWASRMAPHSEISRHYFVLAFETPPPKVAPGMPIPDWSFVLKQATIALSVCFGKLFDSHGLIEGSGLFHVPEILPSFTPYPTSRHTTTVSGWTRRLS